MAKLNWKQIREQLGSLEAPPEPMAADQFWTEFRARAALTNQTPVRVTRGRHVMPRFALGVAASVALVCAVWFGYIRSQGHTRSGVALASAETKTSEVEEIEVFVPYSSVLIMQDDQSGGTIVWVADVDPESGT